MPTVDALPDWEARLVRLLIDSGQEGVSQVVINKKMAGFVAEANALLDQMLSEDKVQRFFVGGVKPVVIWRATVLIMQPDAEMLIGAVH